MCNNNIAIVINLNRGAATQLFVVSHAGGVHCVLRVVLIFHTDNTHARTHTLSWCVKQSKGLIFRAHDLKREAVAGHDNYGMIIRSVTN